MTMNPALKRMVILKLCGSPEYQHFTNMFERRMLNAVEQGSQTLSKNVAASP
jgi:hypothetical protein